MTMPVTMQAMPARNGYRAALPRQHLSRHSLRQSSPVCEHPQSGDGQEDHAGDEQRGHVADP